MNYNKIYNPKTKKFTNINSKIGKNILKKYLSKIGGQEPEDKFLFAKVKNCNSIPWNDSISRFDINDSSLKQDYDNPWLYKAADRGWIDNNYTIDGEPIDYQRPVRDKYSIPMSRLKSLNLINQNARNYNENCNNYIFNEDDNYYYCRNPKKKKEGAKCTNKSAFLGQKKKFPYSTQSPEGFTIDTTTDYKLPINNFEGWFYKPKYY